MINYMAMDNYPLVDFTNSIYTSSGSTILLSGSTTLSSGVDMSVKLTRSMLRQLDNHVEAGSSNNIELY